MYMVPQPLRPFFHRQVASLFHVVSIRVSFLLFIPLTRSLFFVAFFYLSLHFRPHLISFSSLDHSNRIYVSRDLILKM